MAVRYRVVKYQGSAGWMLVVAAAEGGQQADGGGPVQQPGRGLTGQPGQLGDHVLVSDVRVAHETEGVGVDGVAEQVQHGELGSLGVGEGVAEPVREGGGQGPGPAQRRVLPGLQAGFPGLDPGHEPLDVLGGGEVVAQRLADQDGDGQRVAGGVAQQRPPVGARIVMAVAGGQRAGELEAFAHRHRRQHQAGGQVTEPGLLVAA